MKNARRFQVEFKSRIQEDEKIEIRVGKDCTCYVRCLLNLCKSFLTQILYKHWEAYYSTRLLAKFLEKYCALHEYTECARLRQRLQRFQIMGMFHTHLFVELNFDILISQMSGYHFTACKRSETRNKIETFSEKHQFV